MKSINNCLLGLYEKALPDELNWEQRLNIAKQAGYDFLEISIDETDQRMARLHWSRDEINELTDMIKKLEMPILTMCLSGNRRYPIGSEDKRTRKLGINLIKDAVDFSLNIGIRIVQLAGYDEYYNETNNQTRTLFGLALQEVVEYAAGRGVYLAFETMDTELMDSIEKAMKYVNEINSPYLQVYPDIGNITATGQDVQKDFHMGKGHIVAIHLKDTRPGQVREIPYGQGTVDFVSFFQLMDSINYNGLYVAEMWATEDNQWSIDYVETARHFLLDRYEESKMAN